MKWFVPAVVGLLACRAEPLPVYPAGTSFRAHDVVVVGTRLRLIDTGTGPAVVFLHGLSASLYSWRHQLEPVLQAGHRVVAFDNRGFGFSDHPGRGYSNRDYAELLVALLDTLGLSQAVLVGHSMGGAIAAEVALAAPARVQGLVLVDPAGYWPRLPRVPLVFGRLHRATVAALVTRRTMAGLLRMCFADPRRVSESDIDQYYAPLATAPAVRALQEVLGTFRFDALRGRADSITAPTLILWGAADRFIPFQAMADLANALPRAAVTVIPGAGHNPQEEQPDEVNRQLIAYLRYGLPATPADLAASRSN